MPRDFNPAPRPQAFSTVSRDATVYGADWPQWQRDLYPVAYVTDRATVERACDELVRNLAIERRTLAWATKARQPSLIRSLRRNVDRQAGWLRNCEAQLRLIDAAPMMKAAA